MQRSSWTELLNGSPTPEVEPDLDLCRVVFQQQSKSFIPGAPDDERMTHKEEGGLLVGSQGGNTSSQDLCSPSKELREIIPDVYLDNTSTDATKVHDQASEQGRKRKMTTRQQVIDIRQNITSTRERKRRTHGFESGRPVSETLPAGPTGAVARPRDRPSLASIKVTSTHIKGRSGGGNRAHDRV